MTKLKQIREKLNLTQQELAETSSISIRTIQRIEAGTKPKGHTLKKLSRALRVAEYELLETQNVSNQINTTWIKIINLSSLVFTVFPPANIFAPLIIVWIRKELTPLTKQIVSLQILWTVIAFILFMLSAFAKNWFGLGNPFNLVVMIILVLSNIFIILRNTAEIDRKGKLFLYLNFSII